MRRVATSRREQPDLLTREPSEVTEDRWTALLIDPVAQVTELADLVDAASCRPRTSNARGGRSSVPESLEADTLNDGARPGRTR